MGGSQWIFSGNGTLFIAEVLTRRCTNNGESSWGPLLWTWRMWLDNLWVYSMSVVLCSVPLDYATTSHELRVSFLWKHFQSLCLRLLLPGTTIVRVNAKKKSDEVCHLICHYPREKNTDRIESIRKDHLGSLVTDFAAPTSGFWSARPEEDWKVTLEGRVLDTRGSTRLTS